MQQLMVQAQKNAEERLTLIEQAQKLFESSQTLCEAADKADKTFLRKLFNFPGDITTHRIAKVLAKIS